MQEVRDWGLPRVCSRQLERKLVFDVRQNKASSIKNLFQPFMSTVKDNFQKIQKFTKNNESKIYAQDIILLEIRRTVFYQYLKGLLSV